MIPFKKDQGFQEEEKQHQFHAKPILRLLTILEFDLKLNIS
jgi:hypothetical protein